MRTVRDHIGALGAAALAGLLSTGFAAAQNSNIVEGEEIATPELVKAACAEGKVTLYSAQNAANERLIVQNFEKAFPCLRVSVISAVTGRLYERVQTEAAAGLVQADALMITDEALTQRLIDEKKVRAWNPPSADKYPATAKGPGLWYSGSGSLMYPVYNTRMMKAGDEPKSWKDLLDPRFKDKMSISAITSGGAAWMMYAFMDMKVGDDYLKKFAAQNVRVFSTYTQALLGVTRGEILMSIGPGLDEYSERVREGAPIKPLFLAEGTPRVNYPIMLLAGSPNPNAGELIGNWYLSKAGQSALVRTRGAYSARLDVPPAKGNPPLADLNPWNAGHAKILSEYDSMIKKTTGAFGGR